MATPEWLERRSGDSARAAARPSSGPRPYQPGGSGGTGGTTAGPAPAASVSSAAGCGILMTAANVLLGQCAGLFDPVVLAQLDAALAHELAGRARMRAGEGAERLEQQLRAGATAGNLADLARFVSTAKATATKAGARAAAATEVVLDLGGAVGAGSTAGSPEVDATAKGFDAEVVGRVDVAALVEVIARLEEVKNAAAAAQAHAEVVFIARQRLDQARAGVPQEKLGKGVAEQVGLARHESAHRGRQLCELAHVVVREMPHTMHAFTTGNLSEYRAGIMAHETACLSVEDRAAVDALVCGDPDEVALSGTRQLAAAAKNAACALDAAAVAKRYLKAESERHVSLRPAADGMTLLTALIPLKQGVRIYRILTSVADRAKASGDHRGKGQVMADALMHRLTRHDPCNQDAGSPGDHRGPPRPSAGLDGTDAAARAAAPRLPGLCTTVAEPDIALELVMTDRALFDGADDPAVLVGHEPIPAPAARTMVLGDHNIDCTGPDTARSATVWLRRLFTHPATNTLLAMDARGRLFPDGMKEFLRLRDQRCATPYCDAPIREYDHIKSWSAGGQTTVANGQGLCTACNQAKEAPGWTSKTIHPQFQLPDTGTHSAALPVTRVTTPTGHSYVSTAPPLPGPTRSQRPRRC